jgi:hypothetical protein
VTRISSPSCGSASTAIERTRLTSRLANAAAVIAGASDMGRSQLLQVMQFQHCVGEMNEGFGSEIRDALVSAPTPRRCKSA